uniref:Myb-related protein 306-like n=1 Tax=Rhizophora mucronata TaxID=61149 RepID=A0A2P2KC90_RHIMU
MFLNIRYQDDIFFRVPWPFPDSYFVTARWSPHSPPLLLATASSYSTQVNSMADSHFLSRN